MASTKMKLSDYIGGASNATSLKNLDDAGSFTILNVVDSNYNDTPGVKITTQEGFEVNGKEYHEFYTTRKAIVDLLTSNEIREDLRAGNSMLVQIGTRISKGNKEYFVLEEI
ncbi:MAG TPA: hypothetical protein VMW74_09930 [Nitrosopumilaceae archaeon]|nr:hypothetical protein [Nitrosopumilaceae archaeon]